LRTGDAVAFLLRERAVLQGIFPHTVDARFAALQLRGFARAELARLQPLLDGTFLIDVALHFRADALCEDHGCEWGDENQAMTSKRMVLVSSLVK
jgi:hypothetical protein